jgi:hypothetical protein
MYIPGFCLQGDGFGGFICQHGERECRGNLMQSCALSLLGPSGPQMEFVYCVMSSTDGSKEGKRVSFLSHTQGKPHKKCFVFNYLTFLSRFVENCLG